MPKERWRAIKGYKGYEVSNLGRVRSVDRTIKRKHWDRYSKTMMNVDYFYRGKILRPGPSTSGHLSVVLGRSVGSRAIHVLVLDAFIGPCPDDKHETCHWDDNPANNMASNLRWGTRSDNLYDAVRNGKKPVGERHSRAKLRESDIPIIRMECLSTEWGNISRLAKKYGVTSSSIRQVRDGRSWRSVL